ncbi:MAG: hypothetical protein RIF36_22180 [Imperialibacter sp.]|uniref:hypothetical protein n=1 Tax=Imperialibacter sp. TaxID=2038411 RepID=UPI0032EDCFA5
MKLENKELVAFERNIYLDVKQFIGLYTYDQTDYEYGYDVINLNKLEGILLVIDYKEAKSLTNYAIRNLKLSGFESEADRLLKFQSKLERRYYLNNLSITTGVQFLLSLSYGSLLGLLSTIFLFVCTLAAILYPLKNPLFVLFYIDYDGKSELGFLSHSVRVLAYVMEIDGYIVISTANDFGILCLIFIKGLIAIVVVNYIFQEISKVIKLK